MIFPLLVCVALPTLISGLPSIHSFETAVEIPALVVAEADSNAWLCEVRTWVRAPDLRPSFVSTADARLLLNGTDCADVVKWEIGLEFKERSIVKILAANVTLPEKPAWNDSSNSWAPHYGIYDTGLSRRFDEKTPYDLALEAYETELSNPAMWEVEGRERKAFETRVELASTTGKNSLKLKQVAHFAIAVPNVNFPPTLESGESIHYGDTETSSSETSFNYRSYLTLRNGSTLKYPSGKTVFIPGPSKLFEPVVSKEAQIELVDITRFFDRERRLPGKCDRDNTTAFEVTVNLPEIGTQFSQDSYFMLNATIRRLHSRGQIPRSIAFSPITYTENTWASTFGRNESERELLKSRDSGGFGGDGTLQKRAQPVKSALVECAEEDAESRRGRMFMRLHRHWEEQKFGTKLQDVDLQSVLVNFTIPWDFLPSFNCTFTTLSSYLSVKLEAAQYCPGRGEDNFLEEDDLEDDSAWSTLPLPTRRTKSPSYIFNHRGNHSITIFPDPPSSTELPISYLDSSALAPKLLNSLPSNIDAIVFKKVSSELRKEVSDNELQKYRYGMRGERIRRGPNWKGDGGWNPVGDVWARKQRREKDKEELAEMRKARADEGDEVERSIPVEVEADQEIFLIQ